MSLQNESVFALTTLSRVRQHLNNKSVVAQDDTVLNGLIQAVSASAMRDILKRAILKTSRTEYFDVREGQRVFRVLGYPIDTSQSITVTYNTEQPRDFTDSNDNLSSNYVICDPDRAALGEIYLEWDYAEAKYALKIAYTGGMATVICTKGTDGACTAAGSNKTFTSASADFVTDAIAAGDVLTIVGGANAGTKTIASVTNLNTLVVDTAWTSVGTTGETWEINTRGGLVKLYPNIPTAIDIQVAYMWQNKGTYGIQGGGVAGASFTLMRPFRWQEMSLALMEDQARHLAV